jgi:hypothetical protein
VLFALDVRVDAIAIETGVPDTRPNLQVREGARRVQGVDRLQLFAEDLREIWSACQHLDSTTRLSKRCAISPWPPLA